MNEISFSSHMAYQRGFRLFYIRPIIIIIIIIIISVLCFQSDYESNTMRFAWHFINTV